MLIEQLIARPRKVRAENLKFRTDLRDQVMDDLSVGELTRFPPRIDRIFSKAIFEGLGLRAEILGVG